MEPGQAGTEKKRYSRLWGALLLVVVSAIAWDIGPVTLPFKPEIQKTFPTMVGYLLLISLFVERAIEVFLSALRSGGADHLDRKLANTKEQIAEQVAAMEGDVADKGEIARELKTARIDLKKLEKERIQYRANSRFISQWMGLGFGIFVSMVGIRVLGNLVDESKLVGDQAAIFLLVDIILSGAVLAGGSEAINKLMKVYNSYMTPNPKEKPKP